MRTLITVNVLIWTTYVLFLNMMTIRVFVIYLYLLGVYGFVKVGMTFDSVTLYIS